MTRAYRSSLREDQTNATRERILDAAHLLLQTTRPVDLSFAAVADTAGTSVRTVYRHFPDADALFLALSDRLLGRMLDGGAVPTTIEEGLRAIRRQFDLLEEDPALFRVLFAVPTRSRVDPPAMYRRILGDALRGVPEADQTSLFALVDLLGSPYAWDVLHANWGLDAERAHHAVTVALRALLDLLEARPDALSSSTPESP